MKLAWKCVPCIFKLRNEVNIKLLEDKQDSWPSVFIPRFKGTDGFVSAETFFSLDIKFTGEFEGVLLGKQEKIIFVFA